MSTYPLVATSLLLLSIAASAQEAKPIQLRVDFTDAPRHLLHVTERIPTHPGLNTFSYPQWIPSQELPGGPIDNLAGLIFHAGDPQGAVLPWRRDLVDAYAFHVEVPDGVDSLALSYDILEVPSRNNTIGTNHTSSHVVMLEPSEVVLYPSNTPVHDIRVTAAIHLPGNWSAATALRANNSGAASLNGLDTTLAWASWRRSQDYYHEGALLWPEADVTIRQLSQGTRSLDDFTAQFFGASLSGAPFGKTGPGVEPYTSADLIKALNAIAPFDWNAFWRIRLNSLTPRPPTAGLEAAGYNYIDSERMVDDEAAYMKAAHMAEMFHSLGFLVMPTPPCVMFGWGALPSSPDLDRAIS